MGEHILSAFDDDLIAVQAKISEMGGLVEEGLRMALDAVNERDVEKADAVIALDKRIDALDEEIEQMATNTIALRAPVAVDLRVLLSALKISTTLERIGDLNKNIARRASGLAGAKKIKMTRPIVAMGDETLKHLTEILDAHAERDAELAVEIWNRDIEIDDMYNSAFRELVTYMAADPRMIGVASQLLFIAKNLERIGDHTTHISEMIYYIVNGRHLGDERPKGEPLGIEGVLDD